MTLSLGNVEFTAFEVPSVITFGGAQSLAVYRLPRGVRVVDALGPDDSDIKWKGVLSGADATDRARMLDSMRMSGQPIALSWDEFVYFVIISELEFGFTSSWWIPYEIRCLVVADPAGAGPPPTISILGAVTADLTAASAYANVSQAMTAVVAAGLGGVGSAPYASANTAINLASQIIENSIQSAEVGLASPDIPTIVNAAGDLAMGTAARGFVARAQVNYAQVAF